MNTRRWLRILKSGPFLLLTGIAATLFILTFGYWYLRAQRQEVGHLARENLLAVLEGKTAAISGWVEERSGDGRQVMEEPRLRRFLRGPDNVILGSEIESWMDSMRRVYGYAALVLLDPDRNLLLESPSGAAERFSRHSVHVDEFLQASDVGFSEIHRSPVDGTIHFTVAAPLTVAENGTESIGGVMLMVVNAEEYLFPLVQAWPYKSDTSEALLVRREGDEVLFVHDLRHQAGAALTLRLPLDDPELPAAISLRGDYASVREGLDYRGVPVMAATAPVPGTPWHMVVKTDKEEVYASFNRSSRNWAIQMGLLIGLLWLGGSSFWRRNQLEHLEEKLEQKAALASAAQDAAIRMKLATTTTGLGVWEWHVAEGRMLWDEQMFRIYGWEVTADHYVTYDDWRTAVLPEDWSKRESQLRQAKEGGQSRPLEFRIKRADTGEIRHLVSIHASRTDETGGGPLVVGTSLDITERKQAEESLRRSKHLLEVSQASAKVGGWELDVATSELYWTAETYRIFDASPAEFNPSVDPVVDYFLPESRRILSEGLEAAMTHGEGYDLELECLTTQERRIFVHTTCEVTCRNGKPFKLAGAIQDITDRKQAEESLRRNTQLLEASQTIAKVGGWELDLVTKELFWTDETYRLHDTSPDEFDPTVEAGLECYPPESRRRISAALEAATTKGESYDLELETRTTKGRPIHVRTTCEVTCREGQPVKLTGTFQDITKRKAAGAVLRRNTQLLEASQTIAKVGGWELDLETKELFWTDETYRLHDTSPDEFDPTVEAAVDYYLPESRRRIRAALDAAMSRGEGYDLELEVRTTKGRHIHVRTSGEVTCREGRPVKLTGTIQDITAAKQAEEALQNSLERIRMATDVTGVGIWEWNIDTGELHWDEQMFSIYGLSPDAEGNPNYEDWRQTVSPEDLTSQEETLQKTIATKGRSQREFRIRRANDQSLRTIVAVETVRLNQQGEVQSLVGSNLDITDRRQAEEEIKRLSTVVEQSPVSIVITDLDGNIQYTNPYFSELTGYAAEEVRGQNPRILKSGETTPHAYAEMWRKISTGHAWQGLFHNRRKDGSLFWEEAVISPLTDYRDKVCGYLAIKTDVTERIRAEQEIRELNRSLEERVRRRTQDLENSNQELESFSYSVSHDLRAPLRAIDGWAQVLLDDFGPVLEGEGQTALNRLRAATQRMGALIDDLLRLSRINRQELERKPVAMRPLVEEVIAELRAGHQDHAAVVSIGPLADAEGSRVLLRQVWANLIGNAFKFTRDAPSPEIEVGSRIEPDGNLVYFVKDNGAGFDMAYADKLFGAFQRLHSAREFEGTGIGLALSQRIVHRHGGVIRAKGEVGAGAEFCFTLSPVSARETLISNPTQADER